MEHHQEIQELIRVIQQEHRSMRRIFGVSIIILSLTLMVLAPTVIRSAIQEPSRGEGMYEMREDMMRGMSHPAASTTASTSKNT